MDYWSPRVELSKKETFIVKRTHRTRKLLVFLRQNRHEVFDHAFQDELASMYRQTGAGEKPIPPAQLAMVTLLQAYFGTSDAEAVECALMDARWGMVLDCLDAEEPPFSQGALVAFRARLIEHDMDKRLLERAAEVAKQSGGFDYKKIKTLSVAVDSRPLSGAGRVEDTFNLLGHALRSILQMACVALKMEYDDVCRAARVPLMRHSSIKAGLDINWNDPEQRDAALVRLTETADRVVAWLQSQSTEVRTAAQAYVDAVAQVRRQDLDETDGVSLIRGVATDRRISIEDPEMRHGRKSRTKRFDGYKQHIAVDTETGISLAGSVTPGNRPEDEGTATFFEDLSRFGKVSELHIDRAYIHSPLAEECTKSGAEIICKPWAGRNPVAGHFSKNEFKIDARRGTITCPAGQTETFEPGETVEFDPETCGACALRDQCTRAAAGRGRTVSMLDDEAQQARFRRLQHTRPGRARLRRRVVVEHAIAHLAARQGPKARYLGVRKNEFDLRRTLAVANLHIAMSAANASTPRNHAN